MKADLTRFGSLEEGVLTCRLHGWQWDIDTGDCLTSDGHQLYTRPAGADDAADANDGAAAIAS
jgi:UDP-MurNAc hydroxylase